MKWLLIIYLLVSVLIFSCKSINDTEANDNSLDLINRFLSNKSNLIEFAKDSSIATLRFSANWSEEYVNKYPKISNYIKKNFNCEYSILSNEFYSIYGPEFKGKSTVHSDYDTIIYRLIEIKDDCSGEILFFDLRMIEKGVFKLDNVHDYDPDNIRSSHER